MIENFKAKLYYLLKDDDDMNNHHSLTNTITEYIISIMICLNVVLIIFESLDSAGKYNVLFICLRYIFFMFFSVEYLARFFVADYGAEDRFRARIKYIFSITAIIDLLALLPVLLGSVVIDFRIFRVLRLLKVIQIKVLKQYTLTLRLVIKLKGLQLFVSLFIVLTFCLIFAVIIYDLENKAQPDVFRSVLDGLWWAISSATTIGYGDTYPVTPLGKLLGSFMSIFGVFLMAVPIGILTSGFFEVSKQMDNNN